eukprot:TRINITY_DN448_c0_g1_i1.p3 TRINITY_DN448_c0_g1~~TRINITY_DN448_c0_g1_i1.p3  ORF type:complete len:53 (+),score=20.88 TRINITY_DN448_c0_g1_i1:565-723(+)
MLVVKLQHHLHVVICQYILKNNKRSLPTRLLTKKKKYRLRGRSSETAKAHRG